MKRSARRAALAAVVGLSLAHPSLSFQAQRAVRWMEPAPGWRGRTCCPALRPQHCAPSLPPAAPLGSTRLRMTATEPEAVGEEDEEDLGVDAAARRAEAEATACVSEVVEIMMGQVRASQRVSACLGNKADAVAVARVMMYAALAVGCYHGPCPSRLAAAPPLA
jgi:hypothetical protein